jgi:hypothetical protein
MEEIQLNKPSTSHLGFSIAGGISHEHVKGLVFYFHEYFFKQIRFYLGIMGYLLQT